MRRSCRLRNCFSPFSCFRRMVLRVSISEGQANCNRQSYSGSSIAIQISKPNPKRKCSVHCGAQRENNIQPGVIGLWLASISVVGIFFSSYLLFPRVFAEELLQTTQSMGHSCFNWDLVPSKHRTRRSLQYLRRFCDVLFCLRMIYRSIHNQNNIQPNKLVIGRWLIGSTRKIAARRCHRFALLPLVNNSS